MEFRILGPLEVEERGRRIEVTAPKHRVLLIALLLHSNEVVRPEPLVDALWDGEPPASSSKLVQVYVSQLRRVLGEGVLTTKAPGYLLRVEPADVDVLRFERLVQEGRESLAAGNARLAAALYRRALGLWRGLALADVAYADFAAAEARRLEELRVECLEERVGADLALGRHEQVLAEVATLAAEHPLSERLRAHLMLALYRCGRQAEALDAYREARRVLRDELGLEPGPELRQLERAMLRQDAALAAPEREPAALRRLPSALTPLIGREHELAELRALVRRPDVRFVTLAGAAGSGKTRLALALAEACAGEFADGAVFVELAALRDPQLVISTIARALRLQESQGEPLATTVRDWLAARELLLVIDNLEQVAAAAPALVELASGAPRVMMLVTSRRVLHVSGEHVFLVPPLAERDAVALFVQRMQASGPAVPLTADGEGDVLEICRRLDGLPLAIELAAARTTTLTPRALLARLSKRLTVLTAGPRDLPARQQTLRETLDWSANLLGERERSVLAGLAVLPGGCTLESAEAVCGADIDTLSALVDDSLLRRVDRDGEPRFTLLETVREYAAELLGAEREKVEARLALHIRDLAESADLRGPEQGRWLAQLDSEVDNIRAALDSTLSTGDRGTQLRIVGALWRYWWIRGHLSEGRARIETALERREGVDAHVLARVLNGAAGLAWTEGDYERGRRLAAEALAAAKTAGDEFEELSANTVLGVIAMKETDFRTAGQHLRRSESIAERLGDEQAVIVAKLNLGVVALESGEIEDAVPLFEHVLEHHRRRRSDEGAGFALLNLGLAEYRLGDHDSARARFDEAGAAFGAIGFWANVGHALQGLAAVEARAGDPLEGARLLGRAASLLADVGAADDSFDPALTAEIEAELRAALGADAFAEAHDEGLRQAPTLRDTFGRAER